MRDLPDDRKEAAPYLESQLDREGAMAMAVVLVDGGIDLVLSAEVATQLGQLGVTNVTLVRGDDTTGIVLEGWAFDPATAANAVAVLRDVAGSSRTLYPVAQTAVAGARLEGGIR
jgi:uncharacterized membrane protein